LIIMAGNIMRCPLEAFCEHLLQKDALNDSESMAQDS